MLQTTAYLHLGHMAPSWGILDSNEKWKLNFLAGLTNQKFVACLAILNPCGDNPVVAFRLMNAADYHFPTFGPHGTKLGHTWFQWRNEKWFSGWFDNSKKGDVSGFHLMNVADYRLPTIGPHGTKLGHSCFQWKMKSGFTGWFDNYERGDVSGHFECMRGWSRCFSPP